MLVVWCGGAGGGGGVGTDQGAGPGQELSDRVFTHVWKASIRSLQLSSPFCFTLTHTHHAEVNNTAQCTDTHTHRQHTHTFTDTHTHTAYRHTFTGLHMVTETHTL